MYYKSVIRYDIQSPFKVQPHLNTYSLSGISLFESGCWDHFLSRVNLKWIYSFEVELDFFGNIYHLQS